MKHVLSEWRLGSQTLPNRVFLPAHSYNFPSGSAGTDALVAYLRRRFEAGLPLAVVGEAEVYVAELDAGGRPPSRFAGHPSVDLYRQLARLSSDSGSLIIEQLNHPGAQVWFEEQRPALGPSAYPQPRSYSLPIPLTQRSISAIVAAFGRAAKCASDAGLSGVEVKADQGKLLHQFFSQEYNRRHDGYGGSVANRGRLIREVLAEVRRQVSEGFIVGIRLSGNVTPPFNADDETELFTDVTIAETIEICTQLEQAGLVDYFSISGETNSTVWGYRRSHGDEGVPEATFAGVSRAIKATANVPVLLSGRILDLATADSLVRDGVCDAVGMARAFIADGELLRAHARVADAGKVNSIVRPCISCNSSCVGSTWYGGQIGCIYDPVCGRESRFPRKSTNTLRKIAVVGAGPAGLEFARSAALYGATVTVFERLERVGGRLWQWAELPGRHRVRLAIDYWLRTVVESSRVTLHLGTEVDFARLAEGNFTDFVWAVGANEELPVFVAGSGVRNLTPSEAIRKNAWSGSKVVVVEGDRFGDPLGIALLTASRGASVDVVTPFDMTGVGLDPVSRAARLDELAQYSVRFHTWCDVRPSKKSGIVLFDHCRNRITALPETEFVIWSLNPIPRLAPDPTGAAGYRLGDCIWPRGLETTTREAHDLAYRMVFGEHTAQSVSQPGMFYER